MVFFTYILVVILHEMAHFFVAKKLGYSMNKIFLLPYGAGISLNQNFVDEKDEILIASAGPLLNFFLAFLTISLWWLFPSVYIHTETFVLANIVTGLINLLPCYPLDGGRILSSFLSKKLNNRKKALKISSIFNFLIVFLFILIFLTDIFKYFTFLLMAIFIFLGHFNGKLQGKYELTNF
ncbi:MAG: M50 family metallopeptidase, partial [Clostridia bacterium]|nr:M50 family metallopeptidase [Clostridia bacterium]